MFDNLYLNIGSMKGGTTWLYSVLQTQPDIYFSLEKEVHYFAHMNTYHRPMDLPIRVQRFKAFAGRVRAESVGLSELNNDLQWYQSFLNGPISDEWYQGLFRGRGAAKYCADFSNLNAHLDRPGWEHVKRVSRNLRVSYILRNPLERLWSHVKFHTKITGQFKGMLDWNANEFDALVRQRHIWENTEYSRTIQSMEDALLPEQMKIAIFDDIHADGLEWLRELESFLGIRQHNYPEKKLTQRVNATKSVAPPSVFVERYFPDLQDEMQRLEDLGYAVPNSWKSPQL